MSDDEIDAQVLELYDWPALRDARLSEGDDFDAVRSVDHFGHFRRRSRARDAAAALKGLGFEVETRLGWFVHTVEATRPERISDAETFMPEVARIYMVNRGRYDGWGAMIVERTGPGRTTQPERS